ncbi:hypothetical protein PF005_g1333 [Phytophthora fragariae]|uniref:Uncharacterized protein n=1 Tax=Phytophthora fragariae TaxID=53985 RepID=A0A6A3FY33_9STRA|nr:hypothetical protein PF009_g1360 [Phytophthora fragariae]KAE9015458.1 hypothetical protein PF011_g7597 [Phytophthora fragariae]KAE9138809.1 hypothetical protein PF007_g1262 [Phytophthora fragariae]KAE9154960.1 hypothetical protein PF006_g1067 [Phytophthora fragariae]KAE9235795.1 hypothetical protein PF005_g1333 [Phytophthora fragariae]
MLTHVSDDKSDVPPVGARRSGGGHGGPPPERCGLAVARVEGSMGSHELAKEMETKHPNLYVLKYRVLEPGQDPR